MVCNCRLQTGCIRTNCLDCLDRTNAVQNMIGLEVCSLLMNGMKTPAGIDGCLIIKLATRGVGDTCLDIYLLRLSEYERVTDWYRPILSMTGLKIIRDFSEFPLFDT